MSVLSNAAKLAQSDLFRDTCLAALVYQARVVIAEPEETEYHEQRMMYAYAVINSPESYRETVTWVVASDPTIATIGDSPEMIPDSHILGSVAEAWNYLAGFDQRFL